VGVNVVRSKALNRAFNRALVDSSYREELFGNLRRALQQAGVPEEEIRGLEAWAPDDLEELAYALEALHESTFEPRD